MPDFDVLVIGAGVAGLSAIAELDRAGMRVLCVEARDRIGGRIFTAHDALAPLPIELGAEFIHGRPPEIWQIVRSAALGVYDCRDAALHIKHGVVQKQGDAWEPVSQVMADMRRAAEEGIDVPFATFLERSSHPDDAKEMSASFVEGFNAAHKEVIGIASLAKDAAAADRIGGDKSFRFFGGYDSIPLSIFRRIEKAESKIRLNAVVTKVAWGPGSAALSVVSVLTGRREAISARKVVVTVPLGVLQAGSIQWDPEPCEALKAAAALEFGQVMRVVLRFREAFWEGDDDFTDAGFLLSDQALFPTWWTPLGVRAPILTGWSAGPHADPLLGKSTAEIYASAIDSLARILAVTSEYIRDLLEQIYFHDWYSDIFARGAYSYVPAGALSARETLAKPVAGTLYFAGEATELNGHSATVHGAIASGRRAAQQIIGERGMS